MDYQKTGNLITLPRSTLRRRREDWPIRLRRVVASEYLEEVHGVQVAPATLAQMASQGTGPEYEKWGVFPYYLPERLDYWAAARLSEPKRRRRREQDEP